MLSLCPASRFKLFSPSVSSASFAKDLELSELMVSLVEMKQGEVPVSREEINSILDPLLEDNLEGLSLGSSSLLLYEKWKSNLDYFENVIVYGDYDVDGICSTVLAMEVLLALGKSVRFFIPHRHNEGYGLHPDIVSRLVKGKCDTLVVLDTGTGSGELIGELEEQGINTFVFDHHITQDGSVSKWIVNPQSDGNATARDLCATAVFWMWAYKNRIMPQKWLMERLDLVALATLADCMELGPLNRALVIEGLKYIRKETRPGLAELIKALDLSTEHVTDNDLVMKVIPSLNAPGRLETADPGVLLLVSRDGYRSYVENIIDINRRRRESSAAIADDILGSPEMQSGHVLFSKDWHVGVLSGVASQICNIRNKPVILAAPANKTIRGTVRVPEGANAMEILSEVSHLLERWGGHSYAAGFSVSPRNWKFFREKVEGLISKLEIEEREITALEYDPARLDLGTFYEISRLGPFGKGNPRPRFFKRRDGSESLVPLGRTGEHYKVSHSSGEFLAFNSEKLWDQYEDILGWVYYPNLNYWKGSLRVQLILDCVLVP